MKRHLLTPALVGQTEESMQAIMNLRLDIIREGNLALKHAEKSIDHVCAAGKMLIDLKERVGHGNFRKELIAIDMKKSTAANYMAVFRYVQRVGHLRRGGLRDALRLISKGDPALVELNTDTPAPEYQLAPPAPKPKPAPVIIDAELVDDAPAPAPAPEADDDDDAAPLLVDGTKPISDDDDDHDDTAKHLPEYIHDDAMRLWSIARTTLGKILHQDASRVKALTECIQYCQSRLDKKTDALAAIIHTLPSLTEEERKTLAETLNSKSQ